MKTFLTLTLTALIFCGCSIDLGSSSDSSVGSEGCTTDIYGQFGSCVTIGGIELANNLWTVWDGNISHSDSREGNLTASIKFLSNGTAIYRCIKANCSSDKHYMWRYYNKTNEYNLTILNKLDGSLYESYEYYYDNRLGEKVFLHNNTNIRTFVKL